MRVAFPGEPGAYGEEAILRCFGATPVEAVAINTREHKRSMRILGSFTGG